MREVVGGYLGAGDEDALLAGLGLLDATVHEERDMGVLLGLGGVKLLEPGSGDDLGQDGLGERLGDGDLDVEGGVVPGHLRDLGQEGGELGNIAGAGLLVDVATVHEAMDANGLHAVLGGHGHECLAVALHRVHAAGAHKTREVQGLVGSGAIIHRLDEDLILLEGAVLDGVVDARELLEDDAAGADVESARRRGS